MFTWHLAENQVAKFEEWQKNLDPPMDAYCGAIGGRFSYIITHTGLGTCYSVRDNMSNSELNVTDYNDW